MLKRIDIGDIVVNAYGYTYKVTHITGAEPIVALIALNSADKGSVHWITYDKALRWKYKNKPITLQEAEAYGPLLVVSKGFVNIQEN